MNESKTKTFVEALQKIDWFEQYAKPETALEFYHAWFQEQLDLGSDISIPHFWFDVESVDDEGVYSAFVNDLCASSCGLLQVSAVKESWNDEKVRVRIRIGELWIKASWEQEGDYLAPEFLDFIDELVAMHPGLSLGEYPSGQDGMIFLARHDLLDLAISSSILPTVTVMYDGGPQPDPIPEAVYDGVFELPSQLSAPVADYIFRDYCDRSYYVDKPFPKPIRELWRAHVPGVWHGCVIAEGYLYFLWSRTSNHYWPYKLFRLKLEEGAAVEPVELPFDLFQGIFSALGHVFVIESASMSECYSLDSALQLTKMPFRGGPIGATEALGARNVLFRDGFLDLDTQQAVPVERFAGMVGGQWFAGNSNFGTTDENKEYRSGILNLTNHQWLAEGKSPELPCYDVNDYCALYCKKGAEGEMLLFDLRRNEIIWKVKGLFWEPRIIGNRIVDANRVYDLATGAHLHGKYSKLVEPRSVVAGSTLWFKREKWRNQLSLHGVDLNTGKPIQKLKTMAEHEQFRHRDSFNFSRLLATDGKLIVVELDCVICYG